MIPHCSKNKFLILKHEQEPYKIIIRINIFHEPV